MNILIIFEETLIGRAQDGFLLSLDPVILIYLTPSEANPRYNQGTVKQS